MRKRDEKHSGVLLTYITQIVKIATGLIYTPVMLSLVGKSEYGIYQIADSVISYLSLINLGVMGAYARFYTIAQRKSKKDVKEVNGTFLAILLGMSAICIAAGLALASNVQLIFGDGFTESEYTLSRTLMLFLVANMAITFPSGVFEHNITVNEKFFTVKLINLLRAILNPFIALPLLLLGYGSVGLVFTTTFLTIASTVIEIAYCVFRLDMRFGLSRKAFSMLKDIGGFTIFIFLNQIIDLINWNIDKILIGRYIGSIAVAVYSVGGQLRQTFSAFPNAIRSVFQPQMYKMIAAGENDKSISLFFYKVGRIQCIILLPILFGFVILGKQFIILWVGREYVDSYYVALCMMIPCMIPHVQDIGIDLQRAKNKHRVRSIVYAIIAMINIGMTILLIKKYGIIGAAVATGISLLLGQGLFMNFYYEKALNVDIRFFWSKLLPMILTELMIAAVFYMITFVFVVDTWAKLSVFAIIYVVVYVISIYYFFLDSSERNNVCRIINRVIKKKF